MSERSAMKRRVRGVLRRRWLGPLAATELALVPCAVAGVLFALLVRPKIAGGQVIDLSAMGLMGGSAMDTLVMIAATLGGGLVFMFASALLVALYNLLQRRLTRTYTALQSTTYSIFAGTLMLCVYLPQAIPEVRTAAPEQFLYLTILGVFSSAVAYCAWAKALSLAENASSVSNYMFVTRKPDTASVLDKLPPWPRYVPILAAAGVVVFAALRAPWTAVRAVDAARADRPRRRG